jgi:hypothetical protein
MRSLAFALFASLPASLVAQTIGIDDLDPLTGTSNTIPWSQTNGYTSLHVYSAAALAQRGVCPGAVLIDLAIAPSSGTGGIYNAPQARLEIGHLAVSPPIPGNWTSHLDQPIVVHDLTSGPYTFPWVFGEYVSLPGFNTTGFVWDGVRDIGVWITQAPGVTGGFSIRRSATQLRHGVNVFNATTQAPTTNGIFAMEVKMTFVHGPNCAVSSVYGAGCYEGAYTWYERFIGMLNVDLGGASVVATPVGTPGHVVTMGGASWYTPTGSQVLANVATPTPMGDNTFSTALNLPFSFPFLGGSTNVMHASSNGYVVLGATTSNASDGTPTVGELLSQQARLCPLWADLHPGTNLTSNPQSGVYYDIDPSGQTVYVTWLDCADRGAGTTPAAGATSINVQLAMHQNGSYEFRYGVLTPGTNPGVAIVGASPGNTLGGNARNPGNVDLTAGAVLTSGPDRAPLALDATPPQLGATTTFSITGVPNIVPLAFVFFGDQQVPPLDLGFLGAPGCFAHGSANLTSVTVPAALPAGTASLPLSVPNDPTLVGTVITSQAVAVTLANTLNLATSNGVFWSVGL